LHTAVMFVFLIFIMSNAADIFIILLMQKFLSYCFDIDIYKCAIAILLKPKKSPSRLITVRGYMLFDYLCCHSGFCLKFRDSNTELIAKHLRGAVENTKEGREGMALGQYIAGMGFSNVGLGIVHSMAHALGAVYDTPHGVANAILLPTVMEYNADATGTKYADIARAMGVKGVDGMTQEEYRKAAVDAVRQLSQDVGIPADLREIVREEDIDFLADSAVADACAPGNPKDASKEDIIALYRSLM